MAALKLLFILGGTFDPVHHGHLRLASELATLAPEAEIHLMPSGNPAHRETPKASAKQRLKMLELALFESRKILVDDFEVNRKGISYTVETLEHLRNNLPNHSIIWVLGKDAYHGLSSWHRISELSAFCHILVVNRFGNGNALNADSHGFKRIEMIKQFHTQKTGFELQLEIPMLEISSTRIRDLVNKGSSIQWLLPDTVNEYIETNKLYKKR